MALSSDGTEALGLEANSFVDADAVIINADLVHAYNNLPLSSTSESFSRRWTSCSSISFYWSLSRRIPELKNHNIFLAGNYAESFIEIFREHRVPCEPSFYVNVPSRADPSAAPKGKDAVIVLVPLGHLKPSTPTEGQEAENYWDELVTDVREAVISTVEQRTGITGLRKAIAHEIANTPVTWRDKFNLDRGAILGLSHSFFNVLSFRTNVKHDTINKLYFVGASTHPGTGVPTCLAGARLTAEQVLGDLGIPIPWSNASPEPKRQKQAGTTQTMCFRAPRMLMLSCLFVIALAFSINLSRITVLSIG